MAVPFGAIRDRLRLSPADLAPLRMPAVALLWLRTAWPAWAFLGAWFVAVRWIVPALLTPLLRIWYPPVRGTGVQFLKSVVNNTTVENPRLLEILDTIGTVLWILGGMVALVLLAAAVKPAVAVARARGMAPEKRPDPSLEVTGGASAPAGATIVPGSGASRRIGAQGRYRIEAEIGRGGMGVVWRGRDTLLERIVALKELPDTAGVELRERFRHEAKALAKLSHPHVVQVYDLVEEGPRLFIAMELIDGGDLDGLLRAGPVPLPRALAIARQIASGLAYAHARGVVHRDVKPLNVLLAADGTAKVTDFGLAKLSDATMHTVEGAVLGSPRYMSPEQAAGKVADARSDVYAFGATLFHLLAGRPPFDGDTASVLAQHITQPPPSVRSLAPGVPDELDALVLRLLAKDPGARPAGLDQVADALGRATAA